MNGLDGDLSINFTVMHTPLNMIAVTTKMLNLLSVLLGIVVSLSNPSHYLSMHGIPAPQPVLIVN